MTLLPQIPVAPFVGRLNLFDKLCAAIAAVLGILLFLLGIVGIFTGCSANFTLPPILGVLPALAGWGILRTTLIAFRASKSAATSAWPDTPNPSPSDLDPFALTQAEIARNKLNQRPDGASDRP